MADKKLKPKKKEPVKSAAKKSKPVSEKTAVKKPKALPVKKKKQAPKTRVEPVKIISQRLPIAPAIVKPQVKADTHAKESKYEIVVPKYKVKQKFHSAARTKAEQLKPLQQEKEGLDRPAEQKQPDIVLKQIEVNFPISIKDLSVKIQAKPSDIISGLMKKGIFANINQLLNEDTAKAVAKNFNFDLIKAPSLEEQILRKHEEENSENLVPRSPVVTLMGHVDHGKTSLLDVVRKSNVTEREAGGITQHIGAYRVSMPKGTITFLDTPGHEAFSAMRSRGATATDIVILVVAADDGVMPQTIEAIDHAKAAGVPIVVAINKVDKPTADIDSVKKQLSRLGLASEDWGGKTIMVGVSAKTKQGVDTLLEMVLLEAEMLELKANINKLASGVVVEGRLSRGRGAVATVLVESGILREGDNVITGSTYGKIRLMINDNGEKIKEALPSVPVEISGLSGIPQAGEKFYVIKDDAEARKVFQQKQDLLRQEKLMPSVKRISLEDIYGQIKEGKIKELKLVLKADVQGSLEALKDSLLKMSTKEVEVMIIHAGCGAINDADAILAMASNAIVIGFNAGVSPEADERIRKEGIDVRFYRIIYDVTSDIKSAMEGMLAPSIEEVFEGRALVKQVFEVSKVGAIAGCIVQKGNIGRVDLCRLIRDGKEVYKGKIGSLKRFKDDAKEVREGFECGIGIANFKELKAGDLIEAFTVKKVARKL